MSPIRLIAFVLLITFGFLPSLLVESSLIGISATPVEAAWCGLMFALIQQTIGSQRSDDFGDLELLQRQKEEIFKKNCPTTTPTPSD
ncbi:hypothetical protein niasHS_005668 [Heterodera schachtii]|uniref:Uncharacterized protein n=1 Tax=Heterodera schachtii TaxID=97005 RepID=A0ABD2JZ44_HETSC